ncbi:MAG: GNAT family N-acetyltransferase [Maritimibacter harenae]
MTTGTAYPWEQPIPGPAADFAATLRDRLPVLTTARLTLRPLALEDFDDYARILTTERARYMDGPDTRVEAWADFTGAVANWLLRGHGPFAVTLSATGETLGYVTVQMEAGDHEPELGFFFHAEAEGNGYAFEAAEAARDYALDVAGLTRLVSYTDPDNARAARLAERLGAFRDDLAEARFDDPVAVYRHAPTGGDGGMEAYA